MFFGDYFPDTRWGTCSPMTMSPIPVGEYALQGLFIQSTTGHMSSGKYVLVSTEACTFLVAIMICSVEQLTSCVRKQKRQQNMNIYFIFYIFISTYKYTVYHQYCYSGVSTRRYVDWKLLFQQRPQQRRRRLKYTTNPSTLACYTPPPYPAPTPFRD